MSTWGKQSYQKANVLTLNLSYSKKNCIGYQHRLEMVGWTGAPSFTEDAYQEVYNFTGGVPRKVNTLCDRLLLFGYLEELKDFTAETVKAVVEEVKREQPQIDKSKVANAQTAAMLAPSSAAYIEGGVSADLEGRLQLLESNMAALKKTVKKEKALLRKAILINLEMAADDEEDDD